MNESNLNFKRDPVSYILTFLKTLLTAKDVIGVALATNQKQLEEVMVAAFGTQTKSSVVSSIET